MDVRQQDSESSRVRELQDRVLERAKQVSEAVDRRVRNVMGQLWEEEVAERKDAAQS